MSVDLLTIIFYIAACWISKSLLKDQRSCTTNKQNVSDTNARGFESSAQ